MTISIFQPVLWEYGCCHWNILSVCLVIVFIIYSSLLFLIIISLCALWHCPSILSFLLFSCLYLPPDFGKAVFLLIQGCCLSRSLRFSFFHRDQRFCSWFMVAVYSFPTFPDLSLSLNCHCHFYKYVAKSDVRSPEVVTAQQ